MAILTATAITGLVSLGTKLFEQKDPTPEEQAAKAKVWYTMLRDFVLNEPTPNALSARWKDQLPFKQKSTKTRFLSNNIIGKSRDEIIDVLVGKINDELTPDFSAQTKETILSGMGFGSSTTSSPAGLSTINAGASSADLLTAGLDDKDVNESRIYFYVGGLVLIVVGVFTWLFWKPKKRR